MAERGGKLHDIKETASDAVEIMRELGTPGVQETFDKIREIALIAKDITESMKSPEWQKNLENIRLVSDNFNEMSNRMESSFKDIRDSGIIDDAQELIATIKDKMGSFGGDASQTGLGSSDIKELVTSFKEMLDSIKVTANELRTVVAESKQSGTLQAAREAIDTTSQTVRTIRQEAERKSA